MKKYKYLVLTPVLFVLLGLIGYLVKFDIFSMYPRVGYPGGVIYLYGWLYIVLFGIFAGWIFSRLFRGSNKLPTTVGLVGIVIYVAWLFLPSGQAFEDTLGGMLAIVLGSLPIPTNTYTHIEFTLAFIVFYFVGKLFQKLLGSKSQLQQF